MRKTIGAALLLVASASLTANAAVDTDRLKQDSLATLVDLIQFDTSQPAGNEILAANYLKARLDAEGIENRIYEAAPGRASIVARVRGNGSKRPLLLLGHTDVVTVEPENWSFDPFSGTVSEGKIFGRGAADDKGIVAVAFEILLALHRSRIALDRDVIFLGVADEEGGGGLGITYMVQHHLEDIDAEFAINEGGRGYLNPDGSAYENFSIGTAEKTPTRARLYVSGRAGHGSVPTKDNAIGILATAVSRLFETPLPMALNETTSTFFKRMADNSPEPDASIYRAILGPNPSLEVQEQLREINPAYYSIIRTSVVPTIFEGGYQRNVIPSEASATLDIRALPGIDVEEMFEALRDIIDDSRVEIRPMKITRPAHKPSPLTTELFRAFEEVLTEQHPEALVLPTMLTGATDSAQLRAAGIPTYGFGPGIVEGDDNGVHGNDEYLRVAPYFDYVDMMWGIVTRVAATR